MARNPALESRPRRLQISEGAPTPKDSARGDDVLTLRKRLLYAPEVTARLAELALRRPSGPLYAWAPRDGLAYYLGLERLERDLDGTWTGGELDGIVTKWSTYSAELAEGLAIVTVGLGLGRGGYGRREKESTIARAARSIALRAGGLPASQADEQVADEVNRGRRQSGDLRYITASTIAGYRKRLRDRLK